MAETQEPMLVGSKSVAELTPPGTAASSVRAEAEKLAVDHSDDDHISVSMSDTASISSSLFEHVEENGRTYHKYKEGKYYLPNDEKEQNRLDMQHQLAKLSLHGRLHLAPLKEANLKHALDFGTGTGIWAIEFAEQYPNCKVLGSDLSPIQPELYSLPTPFNDIDDEWIYPQPFNFIHSRLMVFCLRNPLSVIQKPTTPSTIPQLQSPRQRSLSHPTGIVLSSYPLQRHRRRMDLPPTLQLHPLPPHGLLSPQPPLRNPKAYDSLVFEEVGFVDVQEIRVEWPIGGWAKSRYHKQLGMWYKADLEMGLEGLTFGLFTRVLGMKKEDVETFLVDVSRDINDKNIHAYQPFYIVFGRKPE
ncbi:related to methyltransferase [Phialocephala subalpina]|uniref:Related to methyltransferase n=1 Tax=Phialocephala subalpina TaxID=576137 RepID=A0A1L7WLC4_9HELO|nr:related to methyltransferase [Phialocephala subalpina]